MLFLLDITPSMVHALSQRNVLMFVLFRMKFVNSSLSHSPFNSLTSLQIWKWFIQPWSVFIKHFCMIEHSFIFKSIPLEIGIDLIITNIFVAVFFNELKHFHTTMDIYYIITNFWSKIFFEFSYLIQIKLWPVVVAHNFHPTALAFPFKMIYN